MARPWAEVANSDAFQSLGEAEKVAARREYFDTVVAPRVDPNDVGPAWKEFDADTAHTLAPKFSKAGAAFDSTVEAIKSLPSTLGRAKDAVQGWLTDEMESASKYRPSPSARDFERWNRANEATVRLQQTGGTAQEIQDRARGIEARRRAGLDSASRYDRSIGDRAGDIAKSAAQGVVNLGRAGTRLANAGLEMATGKQSDSIRGAQEMLGGVNESLQLNKSEGAQAEEAQIDKAQGAYQTVREMLRNPDSIVNGIASSLPLMAPGLGAAFGAGGLARLAKLSDPAIARIATGAAASAGGATSAGVTGADVQDFINKMPDEELRKNSAAFRDLETKVGAAEAKAVLANTLSSEAMIQSGVATTALSLLSGAAGMQGRIAAGQYKEGPVKGLFKATGKEALEEAPQNTAEEYAGYRAKVQVDPTQRFDPGKAAAQGALTAMGQGAAVHALGMSRDRPVEDVSDKPLPAGDILGNAPPEPPPPPTPLLPERPTVMSNFNSGSNFDLERDIEVQALLDANEKRRQEREAETARREAAMADWAARQSEPQTQEMKKGIGATIAKAATETEALAPDANTGIAEMTPNVKAIFDDVKKASVQRGLSEAAAEKAANAAAKAAQESLLADTDAIMAAAKRRDGVFGIVDQARQEANLVAPKQTAQPVAEPEAPVVPQEEAPPALEEGDINKIMAQAKQAPASASNLERTVLAATQAANRLKSRVTGSPQFKSWFGDSKVVDDKGEPMVVYHGGADIAATKSGAFKAGRDGGSLGTGIYFTPDLMRAVEYTPDDGSGTVNEVYVSIKKPLVINMERGGRDPMVMALTQLGMSEDAAGRMVEAAYEKSGYITTQVKTRAQAQGYDGIIENVRDQETGKWIVGEIVAWHPSQIKSAHGNNGNFDPKNPSILKRRVTEEESKQTIDGAAPGQREQIALIDKLAKIFKKKVVYYNEPGGDNGYVIKDDPNTLYLNIASKRALSVVFGHELLHTLRRTNEDVYEKLVRRVLPLLRNAKDYRDWLEGEIAKERIIARGEKATPEAVKTEIDGMTLDDIASISDETVEELLADFMGNHMSDVQFWRDVFAGQSQAWVKSIYDSIVKALSAMDTRLRVFGLSNKLPGDKDFVQEGRMDDVRKALAQAFNEWSSGKITPSEGVVDGTEQRVSGQAASIKAREGELLQSGGVRGGAGVLGRPSGSDTGGAQSQDEEPLAGLPSPVAVDGRQVEFGPFAPAREAARKYMEQAGLPYNPPSEYAKLDKDRARRIAAEFEAMKHAPNDPEVKAAYRAMIDETAAQYEAILGTGLKIEFIDFEKTGDPYGNPRNAILDVVNNNHLWVFSTDDGFGSSDADISGNPLLEPTKFKISGKTALANDLFRVVHDYFGHIKEGVGFRAEGEENAWQSHVAMYSPLAAKAMTSETRGQNSWVNFGPKGEQNQTASAGDTNYADQKIGLLPDWVMAEGRLKSRSQPKSVAERLRDMEIKDSNTGVNLTRAQRAVSLDKIVYDFGLTNEKYRSIGEMALAFDAKAAKAFKGTDRSEYTASNERFIAGVLEHEATLALQKRGNAKGWYKRSLDNAIKAAADVFPEIVTKDGRFIFSTALAITSNGQTIAENVRLAFHSYNYFRKNGAFPASLPGGGERAHSMVDAFNEANGLIRSLGVTGFREFALNKQPSRMIRDSLGMSLSAYHADAEVYGGAIFGPKIGGAFLQNLNGNFDALTIDLWMMRMFGRITGNLSGSSKTGANDTPKSAGQRVFIESTMRRVLDAMNKRGHGLEMADLQALLWYPEKELYSIMGVADKRAAPTDYEVEVKNHVSSNRNAARGPQPARGGRGDVRSEAGGKSGGGSQGALFSRAGDIRRAERDEAGGRSEVVLGPDVGSGIKEGFSSQVGRNTPDVSLRSPQPDSISAVGIHYGKIGGLASLDGRRFGTGARSEEASRIPTWSPVNKRVYFYAQRKDGVIPKSEGVVTGNYVYRAKVNNLYDFDEDPRGLVKMWEDAGKPNGMTGLEMAVLRLGYDGYMNSQHFGGAFVILGHNLVPVESLGTRSQAAEKIASQGTDHAAHQAATSPKNDLNEPSLAQIEAGNYKKGHVRIGGLDIAIENPAGSKRRPEWPTLMSHYGYIKRTEGNDGDHLDVFVKKGTPSDYSGPVYVVDQTDKDGKFDEHKVMLGWPTLSNARTAYLDNYTPGWDGLDGIRRFGSPTEFREWLDNGDLKLRATDAPQVLKSRETPNFVIEKLSDDYWQGRTGRYRIDRVEEAGEERFDATVGHEENTRSFMSFKQAKDWLKAQFESDQERGRLDSTSVLGRYTETQKAAVLDGWKEIAKRMSSFKFGKSDAKGIREIAKDLGVDSLRSVMPVSKDVTELKFDGDQRAELRMWPDGTYYLEASDMRPGGDGNALYQIALTWAKNNGEKLVPDTMLSWINTYRRTEQLFSAALRLDTTKHMEVHPDQRIPDWNKEPKTKQDDDDNILRLALTTYENTKQIIEDIAAKRGPIDSIEDLRYNFDTGIIEFAKDGKPFGQRNMDQLLNAKDAREMGLGELTLARALITQELLGDEVMAVEDIKGVEEAGGIRVQNSRDKGLMVKSGPDLVKRGVLYSRTGLTLKVARKLVDLGLASVRVGSMAAAPATMTAQGVNKATDATLKIAMTPATAITSRVYDRLAQWGGTFFKGGETRQKIAHGLIADYGLPEPYIDARDDREIAINKSLRKSKELIDRIASLDRQESRVAYLWMQEKPNTQEEQALMSVLPSDSVQTLTEMKKQIDDLGREAVSLGLLSQDSYDRNNMAYLHRTYQKYEMENPEAVARGQTAKSIRAEAYRGRGLRDDVAASTIGPVTKGDKFVRLEKRSAGGALQNVGYVRVGQPVPAKYQGWTRDGEWEARFFDKPDQIGMWRDLTAQERGRLGEMDEVRYAFARTMIATTRDIETAKFLLWVSKTYAKSKTDVLQAGGSIVDASDSMVTLTTYAENEWVQVPSTDAKGTDIKRYGDLAGRYIPGRVWNDIRSTMALRDNNWVWQIYDSMLKAWKISKTALSPGVHTNNVMANFVMADMADVGAEDIRRALNLIVDAKRGNAQAKAMMERFYDSGSELSSQAAVELRADAIEPLLKELEKQQNAAIAQVSSAQAVWMAISGHPRMALAALAAKKAPQIAAAPFKAMIEMYRSEDSIFRLAKFLNEVKAGKSDKEAGKLARHAFLDYRINAPWIQMVRRGPLPFIAFTYRAVPLLIDAAANKPWKFMKYFLVGSGLNMLAYSILGSAGDEDKERKLMAEEKSGRALGIFPRMMRMPWNDENGSPVFLDVRRWIPGGDIMDLTGSKGAVALPQWLSVGGPLALLVEMASNKNVFTGKPIVKETDTKGEAVVAVLDHLYKFMAPNLPVPNPAGWWVDDAMNQRGIFQSYSWKSIESANKGETDAFGRERNKGQAVAGALGVKVGSYPADVGEQNAKYKYDAAIRELNQVQTEWKRMLSRNGVTQEQFDRKMQDIAAKKEKAAKEFGAKVE